MADDRPERRRTAPVIAVAVFLAAVLGLVIGKAASPETVDPEVARDEAVLTTRQTTLEEIRRETARQGYREGRESGARRGRASGRRAGRADGRLLAQLEKTKAAESEAAGAQAELSKLSKSPPAPSARPRNRGR